MEKWRKAIIHHVERIFANLIFIFWRIFWVCLRVTWSDHAMSICFPFILLNIYYFWCVCVRLNFIYSFTFDIFLVVDIYIHCNCMPSSAIISESSLKCNKIFVRVFLTLGNMNKKKIHTAQKNTLHASYLPSSAYGCKNDFIKLEK